MSKRALIIVDPQVDFITGTLPVTGAAAAMDRLAERLPHLPIDHLIVTIDAHPIGHCSFEPQGGLWPTHCVKYSEGAAIWASLMQAMLTLRQPITFLEKGVKVEKDEYSAFEQGYPKLLDEMEEVLLCGIAGNVCVLNSLKDLAHHGLAHKLRVITDASPSLDDGTALKEMIQDTGVKAIALEEIR